MSAHTDRGPTKARTYLKRRRRHRRAPGHPAKGERSLVSADRDELVLSMREGFQATMRHDLIMERERRAECSWHANVSAHARHT